MNNQDLSIKNISLNVPNKELLTNTDLVISHKKKYGLIGHNGLGKTTLLNAVANKEFGIPKNTDILLVEQEVHSSNLKKVYEVVLEANNKRERLLKSYNQLKKVVEDEDDNVHDDIDNYDELLEKYNKVLSKLKNINSDSEESKVRQLLFGLGFDHQQQNWTTDKFSGGWRMRISLAKALYMKPKFLFLDEPTNHLDLNAVIWLTDYLSKKWKNALLIVSHDKNFLNEVCNNIIHLSDKKLTYYNGNYDSFLKGYEVYLNTREKDWKKVENKIKEMRKKSTPKKTVDKFIKENEYLKPMKVYRVNINFFDVPEIDGNLVEIHDVNFKYANNSDFILKDVNFGIDMGSCIVIVGKNGVGKSTLLKLLLKELKPTEGDIWSDARARIGYYHQHSEEVLPLNQSAIDYLNTIDPELGIHNIRKYLGTIGLDGKLHTKPMNILSGGQKARVVLISIIIKQPHILILDEPSNHLDIETIDAFIDALNEYNGGVVMVTHNIELIERTDAQILEVENGYCTFTDFDTYYDKVLEEINA